MKNFVIKLRKSTTRFNRIKNQSNGWASDFQLYKKFMAKKLKDIPLFTLIQVTCPNKNFLSHSLRSNNYII